MVPPGASFPSCSARRMMPMAARSWTLPPGFRYSSFANASADPAGTSRFNFKSGVSPTSWVMSSATRKRDISEIFEVTLQGTSRRAGSSIALRTAARAESEHRQISPTAIMHSTKDMERNCMRRFAAVLLIVNLAVPSLAFSADEAPLTGYAPRTSQAEREWETKFRAIPDPANLREYMRRLSARPHHVGSPYDKDNAEWILARFKDWGLDAHIERFDVLFPTPKVRVVEMLAPAKFTAKLEEPAIAVDPTSNQKSEQLPTYN